MLIGFTKNTSKKLSKIFCKNFRHCAVLFDFDDKKYKYLFVQIGIDGVKIIPISDREIKLLQNSGWVFVKSVKYKVKSVNNFINFPNMLTCVGFTKRAMGIKNPFILTPDGLYKKLKN